MRNYMQTGHVCVYARAFKNKYGSRHTNLYDVVNPIIKPSKVSPEPPGEIYGIVFYHIKLVLKPVDTYMCNYM